MTIEPDSLAHLVLHQADVDWLEIGNPNFYGGFFERDLRPRKALVLQVIRALAEAGYIQIGELVRQDPDDPQSHVGWVEWPGTLDEQMDRLAAVYDPEAPEDDWYWVSWLNLTDSGREVVESLPKPSSRFFEWAGRLGKRSDSPPEQT